jgi:DNA-directed RNA polymerase specialized sigma24 family protein
MRAILAKCLNTLSPNLRVVFILRDIDGIPSRKLRKSSAFTPNAVKSRLSRAVAASRGVELLLQETRLRNNASF